MSDWPYRETTSEFVRRIASKPRPKDIVDRLRELELYDSDLELFEEAATEIEKLRAALQLTRES